MLWGCELEQSWTDARKVKEAEYLGESLFSLSLCHVVETTSCYVKGHASVTRQQTVKMC